MQASERSLEPRKLIRQRGAIHGILLEVAIAGHQQRAALRFDALGNVSDQWSAFPFDQTLVPAASASASPSGKDHASDVRWI